MALSDVTVTFNLTQLLGEAFDARRTRAYVKTNVANGTLMDTSTGEIRLGDQKVTIADDGTGSFTTWAPGVDGNPTSWQTSLVVEYPRTGQRDRQVRTFGPYTITASADLADLEEEQAVPAEYLTQVTDELQTYSDAAEVSATSAAASATSAAASATTAVNAKNQASEIALGDADATLAAAIENPASDTYSALTASNGLARTTATGDGTTNDRAALSADDTAAAAFGAAVHLASGTYKVDSNLTISSPVSLAPGAVIKPANGVTVTLGGGVTAGLRQIFDHSLGGLVVPLKVEAYHPAWWGAVNTNDDSTTWNRMLASAAASTLGQTVRVPMGTTRLWEVDAAGVHIDASGITRTIAPAVGSTGGTIPSTSGANYVLKLDNSATISGGQWTTDDIAGVTCIYYTGTRSWIDRAYIRPRGAGSYGIVAHVGSGSITPRILNTVLYGADATLGTDTGTGIRISTPDAELTNTWVGRVGAGIEIASGSATLTAVHVWGTAGTGVTLSDACRMIGCYIETCGGWGVIGAATDHTVISGTRFWANGWNVASTGGLKFDGNGVFCEDNRVVDCHFDDNVGDGILIDSADRTIVDSTFVSTQVKGGGAAVGTYGVRVTSGSLYNQIRPRGPGSSAFLTGLISDAGTGTTVDYGSAEKVMSSAFAITSVTSLGTFLSMALPANTTWVIEGWAVVDGGQTGDIKFRVQATSSTGATGWWGIGAGPRNSATSTSAESINPTNAATLVASGGNSLPIGTVGTGAYQSVPIYGVVNAGSANGTLDFQAAQNTSDATASTIQYAYVKLRRVA